MMRISSPETSRVASRSHSRRNDPALAIKTVSPPTTHVPISTTASDEQQERPVAGATIGSTDYVGRR
jgi:hypothetical protein